MDSFASSFAKALARGAQYPARANVPMDFYNEQKEATFKIATRLVTTAVQEELSCLKTS